MTHAAEQVTDAFAGANPFWLLVAVGMHLAAQLMRGLAWHGALGATWPGVPRRRVCAWYLCGAGLSGLLSGRGGDVVRLGLAKREIPDATWPALAGTALVETGAYVVVGLPVLVAAARALPEPSPAIAVALSGAALAIAVGGARSQRVRRVLADFARGCAALRHMGGILAWEVAGRCLRLAAVAAFLFAFGLPATIPVIVTVGALYGSGGMLPIPAAGPAASAGAVFVALPAAAGHSVSGAALSAMVVAQPLLLSLAGIAISLTLLTRFLGTGALRYVLQPGQRLLMEGKDA